MARKIHAPTLLLASALVITVLRSWVYLWWGYSQFDSDQAVLGLMASDIAAGRAFPLYMYGQQYMLPVASWLAAPAFAVFSPSVFLLKLPLLALNLAVVLLLYRALRREASLPAHAAFASVMFVALPSVVGASSLLAVGANIEQFCWTLLIWLTRRRPWLAGIVAGVGFVNREFVAYALASVLVVDILFTEGVPRLRLRRWAIQLGLFAAVVAGLHTVAALSPHVAGPSAPVTWAPTASRFALSVMHLASENLPALFGTWQFPLRVLNVTSGLPSAEGWAARPLAVLLLALIAAGAGRCLAAVQTRRPNEAFPLYLVLTGCSAAGGFVLFAPSPFDLMLVRYTLLALLVPVGLVALLLQDGSPGPARRLAACAAAAWVVAQGVPNARLLREYVVARPPDEYGELARYLLAHGLRQGDAPYWVSYNVIFRTNGAVVLRNAERVRITTPPYWFSGDSAFTVAEGRQCPDAREVARWWVCEQPRVERWTDEAGHVVLSDPRRGRTIYDARAIRRLVPETTWSTLAFVFEGEPGCWLRGAPHARIAWVLQGPDAMALESTPRGFAPGLNLRLPGRARVRIVDLDTSAVLSDVEWNGEPHALWNLALSPGIARTGVLIELVGAR